MRLRTPRPRITPKLARVIAVGNGTVIDTCHGIMTSVLPQADDARFLSALCVGRPVKSELIAACHREHVGVVVSPRGMQLLRHFRADAVICLGAEPEAVSALANNRIPVVVLASAPWEWTLPGVTVISADLPPVTLARLIREAATGTQALATAPAA